MKNMFLITILILLTNFVTFRVAIEKNLQLIRSEDEIIAEIQLVTNCELSHESFIVVDLETKKNVGFNFSKAYLRTVEGNRLQIQLDPKFRDVTSDFETHPAQKQMTIKVDCNISDRLKNTFDSLRNTFKN
ncbi:hypothetical protein N9P43_01170 [Planktomarina temperata]|jgi:hypothetical protein|nr:hypothetical protein [Planktomarina temperata]MDA8883910.1 hypothetical protein [Planktomarina temperata]MDA9254985.1 hypothetical protein [Planktomarina temperata]MDB0008219.1 hypothetical protein [Planktomarina temperata]MDB4854523.1 hypothetical protein [Planktomarina temperata]